MSQLKKLFFALAFSSVFGLCFVNHIEAAPLVQIYVGSQQNVGHPVSFDGYQSNGDNNDIFEIAHYKWNFGDGSPTKSGEYLNAITHLYSTPGTYTVTLSVTDYNRQTHTSSSSVTVGILPRVLVSGGTGRAISDAISSLNGQPGIIYSPR